MRSQAIIDKLILEDGTQSEFRINVKWYVSVHSRPLNIHMRSPTMAFL
ncbi:hypothetical protein [Calothrix sp. PCC 7507]|nr:hypothetical protein [Calothrix sp. PCC 7507]